MSAPTRPPATPSPVLAVRNLEVVYSDVILVLRGVSLTVAERSIVALLGANGAGKTTLLRAITGLLPIHRGRITKGGVEVNGTATGSAPAPTIVRLGVAQVMEGRRLFGELTVEENLRVGGFTRAAASARESLERIYGMFPRLAERRRAVSGYLSGGEQQMVAIGRALMSAPRLLLLDEPSLGLAPKIVNQVRDIIQEVHAAHGTSVLLVEQNAAMALSVAQYGYVMEHGKIVRDGPSAELKDDQDVREFYLGGAAGDRRSFRDVKTYRRKKRWSA